MNSRPRIGITGPKKGGAAAWLFTAAAVWIQGGRPLRIYPGKSGVSESLDGLILGGGADINPKRYGALLEEDQTQKPKPKGIRAWMIRIISILFYPFIFVVRNVLSTKQAGSNTGRDELELALLDKAIDRNIPVLGICRGAQLINVKFGGSLHQDISGFYTEVPEVHTIWPRKQVCIQAETKLRSITQSSDAHVNTLHNQSVNTLGQNIIVSAVEKNGVIQGIEHIGYDYVMGVQWHPEYMPQISKQRRIFQKLVSAARTKKRIG